MAAKSRTLDLESGSSQYASKSSPTSLTATDISIEAWVKPESLTSAIVILSYSGGTPTNAINYRFRIETSGALRFNTRPNGSSDTAVTSTDTTVTTGKWQHVAVTFSDSGNAVNFYVDGVADSGNPHTFSVSLGNDADTFYLGVFDDNGSLVSYFDGLLADVRIWDDVRNIAQIKANMGTDVVANGDTGNLLGYWKLNDDYTDEVGNNNLTASGSPVFGADLNINMYDTFFPSQDPETSTVDGYVLHANASTDWATVRGAATGTAASDNGTQIDVRTGLDGSSNFGIYRGFITFDTSVIANGATIDSANLKLTVATAVQNGDNDGNDYISVTQASALASPIALSTADYNNFGATEAHDAGQRKDISSLSSGTEYTWTFNGTGEGFISDTTVSRFSILEGHDLQNDPYAGSTNTNNRVQFHSSENATGILVSPKLEVDTNPAADTFVPRALIY